MPQTPPNRISAVPCPIGKCRNEREFNRRFCKQHGAELENRIEHAADHAFALLVDAKKESFEIMEKLGRIPTFSVVVRVHLPSR